MKKLHEVPLESLSTGDKVMSQVLFLSYLADCERRDFYRAEAARQYVLSNRSSDWRVNQQMFLDKWKELGEKS
jgi:hypothetical protein